VSIGLRNRAVSQFDSNDNVHPENEYIKNFSREAAFLTSKNAKKEKEENSGSKQGDGFLCDLAPRGPEVLIFQMGRGKGYSALAFSKCSTMLCFYQTIARSGFADYALFLAS
jgi:hypothetical protein